MPTERTGPRRWSLRERDPELIPRDDEGLPIRRYPLRYDPVSTTVPNAKRLPTPSAFVGMGLAFRSRSSDHLEAVLLIVGPGVYAATAVFIAVFGSPLVFALLEPLQRHVSFEMSATLAAGAAVLAFFYMLFSRKFPLPAFSLPFVVPPLGLLALYAFRPGPRFTLSVLLAPLTLLAFAWQGGAPFAFERDWLYSAPQLRPETRREHPRAHPIETTADLRLLTAVLAVAVFVPTLSAFLAIVGIVLVCAVALARDTPALGRLVVGLALATASAWYSIPIACAALVGVSAVLLLSRPPELHEFHQVLSNFFNYDDASAEVCAPGLWAPEKSFPRLAEFLKRLTGRAPATSAADPFPIYWRESRHRTTLFLATSLFATLAVALSLFFPWDLLRGDIVDVYGESAPQAFAAFRQYAYIWAEFASQRLGHQQFEFIWCFALALLLSLIVPLTVALAIYRRPLQAIDNLRRTIEGHPLADGSWQRGLDDDERTEWECYVDRLRDSDHVATGPDGFTIREADHLFLGVEPGLGYPVLLHQAILMQHAYFLGASGSGKTSLGLTPLLIQRIRGSRRAPDGDFSPPPPLIILDLKGDRAFFHTIKHEVETRRWRDPVTNQMRGSAFHFFTPVKGFRSDYFNPFQSFDPERRSLPQLAQIVIDALLLAHGPGYGRSFYQGQHFIRLLEILSKLHTAHRLGPNAHPIVFQTIADALNDIPVKQQRNAEELISGITVLTYYPQLSPSAAMHQQHPDRVIDMRRVLAERETVYFWLPAAEESVSARTIGRLALSALRAAAIDRGSAHYVEAHAVIDEFQQLVSAGFETFQEQMRNLRIGLMLANPSIASLKTPDKDLTDIVETSTRLRQDFATTSRRAREEAVKASGLEVSVPRSWTHTDKRTKQHSGRSSPPLFQTTWETLDAESQSEQLKPRFTYNDIAEIADHPFDALTEITRGHGYTQFAGLSFRLRTTFAIPSHVYEERDRTDFPQEPGRPPRTSVDDPLPHDDPGGDAEKRLREQMQEARKRSSEQVEDLLRGQPRPSGGKAKPGRSPRRKPPS